MALILTTPKLETFIPRSFNGLLRQYSMQTRNQIPAQWMDYAKNGLGPGDYFGLSFNHDMAAGTFDYLCGTEAEDGVVSIAGLHARFATKSHISAMQAIWDEIYGHWLTLPDYRPRPGPAVEYFPAEFDGVTGLGGFELWVPIEV